MAAPLRLLLVEDTEDDAVLLLRELRRGGYEVACRRVETPEEFSAALLAETWDLVIADYTLPRFSAPAALAIFKQSQIDIPFIVVSGRVGEETAVAAMKAGAHDYVMKASLVRLPAAIARELEEAQVRRERKQAAAALHAAKEAAEAASRAKSTFLANMSHEIRTPLNAVIGMTELVLEGPLSAQQRDFLMTVKDSGEALLSVIDDILDFSRIEAGKLTLDNCTFDLWKSLGNTMNSFAIQARQRGLELTCSIDPQVPRVVVGDYNRLRQIVTNLVANALKFTDKGKVGLEVTREPPSPAGSGAAGDGDLLPSPTGRGAGGEGDLFRLHPSAGCNGDQRNVLLHFLVSDTGIGIPQEKQAKIFEMFEQADNSSTRPHAGTGLGLAIVARLVALMNGSVRLESEFGRGSRFHFLVRLGLAEEKLATAARTELPTSAAQQPHHVPSLHVLLAEDSLVNQKLAVALLEGQGHTVALAGNGKEAVAAAGTGKFDLLLMDVQMPEMDGLEAAAEIREREQQTGTHLPIIAMTAHALKGDRERCLAAGMDDYVAKPIHADELFAAIDTVVLDRKRDSPAGHPIPQDVVNWAEALKTVQGNRKVLKSMTEAALEEIPQLVTAIRQTIANGDNAGLRFAAHTLKGSVRYFGASQVCQHAAKLEDMGRKAESAGAEAILASLDAELARVTAALSEYLKGCSADRSP